MANINEQEVAVKLTEVEARCKYNTHHLDNVEKRQNALDKLAESIGRMDEEASCTCASEPVRRLAVRWYCSICPMSWLGTTSWR